MSPSASPIPVPETYRLNGVLLFYVIDADGAASVNPHAYFRVCRDFIDDLTRFLPIRLRIQLESELARGTSTGQVAGKPGTVRWEFRPDHK